MFASSFAGALLSVWVVGASVFDSLSPQASSTRKSGANVIHFQHSYSPYSGYDYSGYDILRLR